MARQVPGELSELEDGINVTSTSGFFTLLVGLGACAVASLTHKHPTRHKSWPASETEVTRSRPR